MSHKITVFRGDGIGPELVDNVLKILKRQMHRWNMKFSMLVRMSGNATVL